MADGQAQQQGDSVPSLRRIRRACDGCRARRVKCNGDTNRCQQCSHLGLRCVYSAQRSKSSRSGVTRGSVIAQLKGNPTSLTVGNAPRSSPGATLNHHSVSGNSPASVTPQLSGGNGGSDGTLPASFSRDFFRGLIGDYTLYVYEVNPIISPPEMLESIDRMDQAENPVDYALVHAYAAVTVNLTTPDWQADHDKSHLIHQLLGIAMTARSAVMTQAMSVVSSSLHPYLSAHLIMTAIFIEICLMAVDKFAEAFLILREAIGMIQLLGVDRLVTSSELCTVNAEHGTKHKSTLSLSEKTRRIRLYWEAFIHERFLTIMADYPPALPPLPPDVSLPREDASIPINIHVGWQYLIKLFSVLDDDFVRHWRSSNKHTPEPVTAAWIEAKMHYLNGLYDIDLELQCDAYRQENVAGIETASHTHTDPSPPGVTCLSTLQKADIIITRQWLLMLLWQLAISNFLLSSESASLEANAMSLQFPVMLSQQLRQVVVFLGRPSIERHGSGILRKLFEITNSLADVIIHVPPLDSEQAAQRMDDFNFLSEFLHNSVSLREVQLGILAEKSIALKARSR
ncbi:hypothetical protein PFICI_00067 [Pestalotiopsis fici W106-1]|uniref:Zn(2)-C6 fungal-type domain-containing protein n=1 Tax=Pestalotiopsis fici (strain W106-1 / CGMCC3.15140) TaxID=1229662 RepID=W3XJQ1_PESFW|nr:uncharacterized protein PFICI_00067 [Pestalotiopsis fici W106-1]ETS86239.1 hypothetical protein PFICI_00067 [Pestalotiopsis fici W106-1]